MSRSDAIFVGMWLAGSAAYPATAEARCAVMPVLAGRIQAKSGSHALLQYSCGPCKSCQNGGKTGCVDMETGQCLSPSEGRLQPAVGRRKFDCRPFGADSQRRWGGKSVVLPPEIAADGDVFLKTETCGDDSPHQVWLLHKTNKAKYVKVLHQLEGSSGKERADPGDINGIMIAAAQKDMLGCRDRFCEYSILFTIDGEDPVLKPGQTYRGRGFTLKCIASRVAAEGAPVVEGVFNSLAYEVFFDAEKPPSAGAAGPSERSGSAQGGVWIEYAYHNGFKGYTDVLVIMTNGAYRSTRASSREDASVTPLAKGDLDRGELEALGELAAASGFMRLKESYDVSGGVLDAPVAVITLRSGGRAKKVSVMTSDNEGESLPAGLGGLYRWLNGFYGKGMWSRPAGALPRRPG
ncbi:MAG: hypothetical protein HY927_01590 [Elusimicrobia bacterium]|nr:hypothetical protein [Elusimicrobiota bacterium]